MHLEKCLHEANKIGAAAHYGRNIILHMKEITYIALQYTYVYVVSFGI